MYVISGATGHIGSRIASTLLAKREKVRVIGRDAGRLKQFVDQGAEASIGDIEDSAFLTKAFTGAAAAFVLIPPYLNAPDYLAAQNKRGEAIFTALKNTHIPHVVNLSSIGAHLPEKAGIVQPLYFQEQRLNRLERSQVVHLRPGYFMENTLNFLGMIKQMGILGSPLKANLQFPFIATQDIADRAAQLLQEKFNQTTVQYLLGPRDMTYSEITKIIGRVIGKEDLNYVEFPYDQAEQAMQQMGMSASVAHAMVDFQKSFNEGLIQMEIVRDASNTTPTKFEDFAAQNIAPAFKALG